MVVHDTHLLFLITGIERDSPAIKLISLIRVVFKILVEKGSTAETILKAKSNFTL